MQPSTPRYLWISANGEKTKEAYQELNLGESGSNVLTIKPCHVQKLRVLPHCGSFSFNLSQKQIEKKKINSSCQKCLEFEYQCF